MKQPHSFIPRSMAYALLLLAATACSNENELIDIQPDSTHRQKVTFTALLPDEDPSTRVSFDDPDVGTVGVTWSDGDDIIAYNGGTDGNEKFAWFGLTAGAGTASGTFAGDAPMEPQPGWQLIYPAQHVQTTEYFGGILTGQTQVGNRSMAHLPEYCFMGANISKLGDPIKFAPLVAMMRFDATLTDYNAATDGEPVMLSITGTGERLSFVDWIGVGSMSSGRGSTSLNLQLKDIELEGGNKLRAYMMVPQFDIRPGTTLIISVTCASGAVYRYENESTGFMRYVAGKRYRATIDLAKATDAVSELTDATVASASLSGYGEYTEEYLIQSAADLLCFVNAVNSGTNYKGKYIKLTTDIRMSASKWTPIGDDSNTFQGTFRGDGHTISGKLMGDADFFGFFGITEGATIQNLHIAADIELTDQIIAGSLVGGMEGGQLLFCNTSGKVSLVGTAVSGIAMVGGLCGMIRAGELLGCTNRGDVTITNGANGATGGLIGTLMSIGGEVNVRNCANYGAVSVTPEVERQSSWMGGFVGAGMSANPINLTDCVNYGKVTGALQTTALSYTGGLCGLLGIPAATTLHNCFNRAVVTSGSSSSGDIGNGGLVGMVDGEGESPSIFSCCEDTGSGLPDLVGYEAGTTPISLTPCNAYHRDRTQKN